MCNVFGATDLQPAETLLAGLTYSGPVALVKTIACAPEDQVLREADGYVKCADTGRVLLAVTFTQPAVGHPSLRVQVLIVFNFCGLFHLFLGHINIYLFNVYVIFNKLVYTAALHQDHHCKRRLDKPVKFF